MEPVQEGWEAVGAKPRSAVGDPRLRFRARGVASACASLFLVVTTGCVALKPQIIQGPPVGQVCQVVTTWCHDVKFVPDPANAGRPSPGIAGRVYLFGPEIGFPLAGDGSVVVDLYDDRPRPAGVPPILLEEWRIDKDTLARLLKRDTIGWGYTLFLPWGTYKPEITQIRLTLSYQPAAGGAPLYAPATALTLEHSASAAPAMPTPTAATPVAPPAAVGSPVAAPPITAPRPVTPPAIR